jgi:hypothetical protein
MKNIIKLFIFLTLFSTASLQSQTFSFERIDPPIVYDTLGIFEIKNHGKVTNLTNNTFDVTFRITYNLPAGWEAGLCDWHLCHGVGIDSITTSCPSGQNDMYVYFAPDLATQGAGYVTITLKKVSNPSENYTVTFGASTHPVSIKQINEVVEGFKLNQNYPNPFNPNTKIGFAIPKAGYVDLRVYDILGREVKVLLSQQLNIGEYEIEFDAKNLASGMYYYRLQTNDNVSVKKMTLVK